MIGAAVVAVLALSATLGWTKLADDPAGTSGADSGQDQSSSDEFTDDTGSDVDGLDETDPDLLAPEATEDNGEELADSSDPLDLGYELVNQPCSDSYVIILASSGSPNEYQSTLLPALTEFQIDEPGRYLRTDQSCSTFNQAMPDGSPIYAAYLGPFGDGVTACQARMDNTSTSTYVKHLDGANDGPFYCICAYSVSELPLLNTTEDETSSGERRFWMVELQHILFDTGHNPQQLFGGNFGSQTVEMVRSYQRAHDLKASGAIDAATWESMRGSKCS